MEDTSQPFWNGSDNAKLERGAFLLYCDLLLEKCVDKHKKINDAIVRDTVDYLITKLKKSVEEYDANRISF